MKQKLDSILRLIATLLILISTTLPFSSCTRSYDAEGKEVISSQQKAVTTETTYSYVWEEMDELSINSAIVVVALLWPLLALWAKRRHAQGWINGLRLVLEPLLALLSFAYIYFIASLFTTPSYGAYMMLSAYGIYGLAWLMEIGGRIAAHRRARTQS